MYVCMNGRYACVYVSLYVSMYICMHVCVYMCDVKHICIYTYLCMHIGKCICIYIYIHICIYINIYIYMYIHILHSKSWDFMTTYVYVYTNIHIHVYTCAAFNQLESFTVMYVSCMPYRCVSVDFLLRLFLPHPLYQLLPRPYFYLPCLLILHTRPCTPAHEHTSVHAPPCLEDSIFTKSSICLHHNSIHVTKHWKGNI